MARKNFDTVINSYLTPSQSAETEPQLGRLQEESSEHKDVASTTDSLPSTPKPTKASDIKKQKGFYITAEQERKIKLAALNKGTDTSSIVREAIDLYFSQHNQKDLLIKVKA